MGEKRGREWLRPGVILAAATLIVTVAGFWLTIAIGYTRSEGFRAWVDRLVAQAWVRGLVARVGPLVAKGLEFVVGVLLAVAAVFLLGVPAAALSRKWAGRSRRPAAHGEEAGSGAAESVVRHVASLALKVLRISLDQYKRYGDGPALVRLALVFPLRSGLREKDRWEILEEECAALHFHGLVERWEPNQARQAMMVWLASQAIGLDRDGELSRAARQELILRG